MARALWAWVRRNNDLLGSLLTAAFCVMAIQDRLGIYIAFMGWCSGGLFFGWFEDLMARRHPERE